MDEVKDNIKDAYAKGKISELHYKLLIEKISDSTNNQGSTPASRSAAQGSPIKS
ncbi:MAG: hypothetical protein WA667_01640 [Candidatus Nitrosopolaris sp.]